MAANWLRYSNQGATRNQPISPQLAQALGGILPQMGVSMEVFSGGQPGKGSGGKRVGSVRHDHGGAADVFFHKGGRRLDWNNKADLPVFQDIVRQAKAAGVTGFGAGPGYMQPGAMHIGFGKPGVWGAGGSGVNAPGWLAEAYGAAPVGAPGGLADMMVAQHSGVTPQATAPVGAAYTADPAAEPASGLMGDLASLFVQGQQQRQRQREEEQTAEQMRRQALFGGLGSLYG